MNRKSSIDARKIQILWLIVREFIRSGESTGSKSLVRAEQMDISPATIRNDMKQLEEMWLVYQPYNSAGRLPTTRGIRMYVDYLIEVAPQRYLWPSIIHEEDVLEFHDDRLYDLVSDLSNATGDLAFCSSQTSGIYCIAGISHFLRKHSEALGEQTFTILDVVENRTLFARTIESISQPGRINVCIGEENILPELESCALMVTDITLAGHVCHLGLLASKRTDYGFNLSVLKTIGG
jgi:transcriptional regulator of heat shock response